MNGHGGGDYELMKGFIEGVATGDQTKVTNVQKVKTNPTRGSTSLPVQPAWSLASSCLWVDNPFRPPMIHINLFFLVSC
jgi:hypothetical protein